LEGKNFGDEKYQISWVIPIFMKDLTKKIYIEITKTIFDRLVALILIVVCSPLLFFAAVVTLISTKNQILFRQHRIGKDEHVFIILKFRTMIGDKQLPFGKLLRKLSIDEIPQLFNVLTVMPGITGWAQVHGRNESDWNERMAHDIYYAEHISFLLDCKIMILTLIQLFKFGQADFVNQQTETFKEFAQRR
jgi:undecaprenyl phosphate N,N'-diacetylbacillosamine 1-phosphate transferase